MAFVRNSAGMVSELADEVAFRLLENKSHGLELVESLTPEVEEPKDEEPKDEEPKDEEPAPRKRASRKTA